MQIEDPQSVDDKQPTRKSVQRLIKSIHEQTAYRTGLLEAEVLVERLNRKLQGWASYFKLGPVSEAYRLVVKSGGFDLYPNEYIYGPCPAA